MLGDASGAMAAPEHVRLADERVEAAPARRRTAEMVRVPDMRIVILQKGEGPAVLATIQAATRGRRTA